MASRDEQSDSFLNSDVISDDFFIKIVESKLKITRDKFKLRLVLLSPAAGKNENFMSMVYRARVKIEILETKERNSVDVIVKVLLSVMPETKEFGVFSRERFVYEDILASFEKIWFDRAGEVIKFGPRSIKFETDPYKIIVLDDLKAEQYEMMNRKVGLNLAQSKMLLTKLAKFHAASSIRYQKDGMIQTYFDRTASRPQMMKDNRSRNRVHESFTEAIKKYGDCDVYADKIARWNKSKLATQWFDVATPMSSGFIVLNHGDIWINNMLCKSDADGNPLDISMIDFQGSFWASPSNDIIYFLLTSVADDIKVDHFDELVEFYHSELVSGLQKLSYDQHIPTLAEFHVDLLDKGSEACICLMFLLFIVKYDSNVEFSIEQLMTGGDNPEMIERIYNNDKYKKAIKLWLPFLDERGFLDTLISCDQAKVEEFKVEDPKKEVTIASKVEA